MNSYKLLVYFTLLSTVPMVQLIGVDPVITFDVLYNAGIESYADERWLDCANYMRHALEDYKLFQDNLVTCKVNCEFSSKSSNEDPVEFVELTFFQRALKRSDCLRRCKSEILPGRPDRVNDREKEDFENFLVYDYLQICAYKSKDYETAAAAAFTYLLLNPDHQSMKDNVKFYRTLPEVKNEFFKNLELKKYQELYMRGVDSYSQQDYKSSVELIEGALVEYYQEYRACSLLCEASYDHESWPDFYNAVADHWIAVLRCKQKCPTKIAYINGAIVDDYLAEHYNYLQFSYFKEKKIKAAATCAATYLLFKPDNDVMLQNRVFYESQDSVSSADMIPRMNAKTYHETLAMEAEMLKFAQTEYKYSDADEDSERFNTINTEVNTEAKSKVSSDALSKPEVSPEKYFSYEHRDAKGYGPRDAKHKGELDAFLKDHGYTLTHQEGGLEGKNRFVVDGLLNQQQCDTLKALAGYGFSGSESSKLSPFIEYEQYDGVRSLQAAKLAKNETIKADVAQLFFDASDSVIKTTEKYFNTKWPIFIDFKHVVCRKPLLNSEGELRSEMSQPVHTDNCVMGPGGSCVREEPARWWREYTSLLYLNDDFEGGEFAFFDFNGNISARVKPKCGRLLTFNSSDHHGVMSHTAGQRCSVGIWLTMDPEHKNPEVTEAKAVINSARKREEIPVLRAFTQEHDIDLTMTEEELNGPERFAADNVIDEATCQALIELANVGGVAGDGYKKTTLTSVDTENERFAGLTVSMAAESGGLKGDGYKNSQGSPHTKNEMFEGVTVLRAAELAANKVVEPELVRLYMDKGILARDMTAKYFNLKRPLYFDYTHLVCRTSLHDKDKKRTDLSHPVHSDNCLIQPDNSCKKAHPAYTQRDYSSLLYLNDNFTGGDFFFTHQNMTVQSKVRPKCGRMVAFYAGNYHGVEAVTSGQRCALAGWYTLDKKFDEAAHFVARTILKDLEEKPRGPPVEPHSHKEL